MFSVGLIFAFGLSALIVVGGSFVFLGGLMIELDLSMLFAWSDILQLWPVFYPDCWVTRPSAGILILRQSELNLRFKACNDFS